MIRKEPVLTNALVLALLTSGIGVATSMGWVELSAEQLEHWLSFLGVVVVIGGIIVRHYVSPVGDK